jgi:hypothetical protein
MPTSLPMPVPGVTVDSVQSDFLAFVPTTRRIALMYFRHVPCPHRKQDCVCEAIALAWVWYLRLRARGRDPANFLVAFARLAAKAVGSGRRVCGQEPAKDLLSAVCRRRGISVSPLPSWRDSNGDFIEEAVEDNTVTPVPAQVQFRCDFPRWVQGLPKLKRRVVQSLAMGHRTSDVARAEDLSEGRISQMRRELRDDYMTFCVDGHKGIANRRS